MRIRSTLRKWLDYFTGVFVHSASRAWHQEFYYAERWHPRYAMLQEALADTVDYIKTNMNEAMVQQDALAVLDFASRYAKVEGLFLEFGVRTGTTINHIARLNPEQTIHGFDSFEGLPENWTGWSMERGSFGGEGIPEVRDNVRLVKGWFDDTLPGFLEQHPGPVALCHVDSDIYSSAKTVLDNLARRIVPGSIIVFNEYFNYPNWREHEFKAFAEFCDQHEVRYEYLCWAMYEVAVRIDAIRGED